MSKLTVFKGAFLIVPIEHDDATAESLSIAIAELPALVEAAKPIAAILDEMAEHSKTHAAAVMVDTDLLRALRSVLNKIKGGA